MPLYPQLHTNVKQITQNTKRGLNVRHICILILGISFLPEVVALWFCVFQRGEPAYCFYLTLVLLSASFFAKGIQRGGQYIVGVLKQACTAGQSNRKRIYIKRGLAPLKKWYYESPRLPYNSQRKVNVLRILCGHTRRLPTNHTCTLACVYVLGALCFQFLSRRTMCFETLPISFF